MAEMRAAAERYTRELEAVAGARLQGVVLHGSVARGEAVEGVSDVNLLVILSDLDGALLRALAPTARRWLDRERALPLVLTREEWQAASDVFAIETADMLDSRLVLQGYDPLEGLHVQRRHLRLQCERELRVKLIHLREATLAYGDRPAQLGGLLMEALPSVACYLRAALRLAARDPAGLKTPDVLEEGGELVGADAGPLVELWRLRGRQRKPPRLDPADPALAATYEVLERTTDYVDTLPGETS